MLNYIWLGLVVGAVLIGGALGNLKEVGDKALEMARFAVLETALPLIGIMALWLGVMRLAERSGLVTLMARAMRPLLRRLFPEVPPEHPAMGSMLMNMAANMLGLGNAATPLGLRAMRDLESLNPHPGTATNAMCTFLAINTSSIQLIPVTAIAILAANRSTNPTAIVGTTLMATCIAAATAITTAKLLQNLPIFRPTAVWSDTAPVTPDKASSQQPGPETKAPIKESDSLKSLTPFGIATLALFLGFFVYVFIRLAFPHVFGAEPDPRSTFIRTVDAISKLAIPFLLAGFPLYAALRKVKVYEEFVEGAKEGFEVGVRIIPFLVAMLVAIGMFRGAGGIALIGKALGPVMNMIGLPPDLLPMLFMRPLSGSGTLGIFTELVKNFGPDSIIARTAGTIFGSTETTFYVLAVYFGSVAVKRTRHAVVAGLAGDLAGFTASVIICRLIFG